MLKEINREKFMYRLKTVKVDNNWSLKYMGKLSGTNNSNVSKWINGIQLRRNPMDLLPISKAASVSYYQTSEHHSSELYVKYNGGAMHPMILNNSNIGLKSCEVEMIEYGSIYCVKTSKVTYIGYINYIDEENILVKFYNQDINPVSIQKTSIVFLPSYCQ